MTDIPQIDLHSATRETLGQFLERLRGDHRRMVIPMVCSPESVQFLLSRFACDRCGSCCKGTHIVDKDKDGIILLPGEPRRLAELMHMTPRAFRDTHTFQRGVRRLMRYPCPFFDDTAGCRIYSQRPGICRVFPVGSSKDGPDVLPGPDRIAIDTDCNGGLLLLWEWWDAVQFQRTTTP